jgi:hypothetical protein
MANMANTAAYRLSDGRMAVDVDTNKTLTIDDSGYVQNVIADNVVVTLPATATHGTFIVRNGGVKPTGAPTGAVADGSAKVSVSPNAADKIQGGVGGTATDDKDLINTKATSRVGDEVCVENRAETNGPIVTQIKGIWAREA